MIRYLAVIALAGCAAQTPGVPPAIPQATASAVRPLRERSWMAPDAKRLNLLYVSDYQTNDVYAYSYPQGELRGVLAGILKDAPVQAGLCADSAGNVFVPDSLHSSVLEYPHGSIRLANALPDPNEYPYSCAVDPTYGDLAVINLESVTGPGSVEIYAHAGGRPRQYAYGFIYDYYFAGYDGSGNLFIDAGYDVPSEPIAFLELRRGSRELSTITLDQAIALPGGVAWDGAHIAIGDSKTSIIYRFSVASGVATEVGSTRLRESRYLAQFLLDGTTVVGANFHGRSVGFWKYPAGGAPSKTITGLPFPFGVALSKATR